MELTESRVRRRALQQLLRRRGWGLATLTRSNANAGEGQTLAQPIVRDVNGRGFKTIAATLETPATSPRLVGAPLLQWSQLLAASSSVFRPVPAAARERRSHQLCAVGSLKMLRKGAMLQPPLTLPCASPWDPCTGALPLAVREQSSNYVIERGLLISTLHHRSQTPETRTRAARSRGARGQSATRAKMPHFTSRELLDSANATEAAQAENAAFGVGWRLSVQPRSPPSFAGGIRQCLAAQLAACRSWRPTGELHSLFTGCDHSNNRGVGLLHVPSCTASGHLIRITGPYG